MRNKETGLENAALQKFCQKNLLEQILITEYQESSLGLTLAVPPPKKKRFGQHVVFVKSKNRPFA